MICASSLATTSLYMSALTPTTLTQVSTAYGQSGHALGALATNGFLSWVGEIGEHAVWNRVLSAAEIETLLRGWGKYYSITIGA